MSNFLTPEDFNIQFKGKLGPRRCVRVSHPDLKVVTSPPEEEYPVKDINTYGVAFRCRESGYLPGDILILSIIYKKENILQGIRAKVKRIIEDTICCEFIDLGRREEYALDKLVLSIQKEQIKRKKSKQGGENGRKL